MSLPRTIQIGSIADDEALRAGEFILTADVPELPLIVSQPDKNFKQLTWLEGVRDGVPIFQYVRIENNKVYMLEGTEFKLGVECVDLSNRLNINDTTNLSYVWTRDESPIYELNNMAGGIGTNTFLVPRASSVAELSGRYVCEVSNAYGSVTSTPIDIEIIRPSEHPKLLKNLILNGSGDGGLNGWESDATIITKPFLNNSGLTRNYGSTMLHTWSQVTVWDKYKLKSGQQLLSGVYPTEFSFSCGTDFIMFHRFYKKRLDVNEPDFTNPNIRNFGQNSLTNWSDFDSMQYSIPQTIPNEDYQYKDSNGVDINNSLASFFPGIRWMDAYNQNQNITDAANLQNEFQNFIPHYFAREKLIFEKFGGQQEAKLSQIVDLTDISNLIDGKAYGIKHITSQFFAYVGAGITGYRINLETTDGRKSLNFHLKGIEHYYNKERLKFQTRGLVPGETYEQFYFTSGDFADYNQKFVLVANSAIEIEPLVEDQTFITLEYLDELENTLKRETIKGPNERDVWAIKEKVYFPLIWHGIYQYVSLNTGDTNPITVFGQKYTTIQALRGLFTGNIFNDPNNQDTGQNYDVRFDQITDINAKFLLNKYNFTAYQHLYPTRFGYGDQYPTPSDRYKNDLFKALKDHGAAGMFGVGKNIQIPVKTRSVKITVTFKNTALSFKDRSPEAKGWLEQEIYADYFADGNSNGLKDCPYGYPRCGITSMKFLLFPNDFKISSNYLSYDLPPVDSTVVGLQKAKYSDPNAFDTSNRTDFRYDLIKPTGLPTPPPVSDPYVIAQTFYNIVDGINNSVFNNLINSQSLPPTFDYNATSQVVDGMGDDDVTSNITPTVWPIRNTITTVSSPTTTSTTTNIFGPTLNPTGSTSATL